MVGAASRRLVPVVVSVTTAAGLLALTVTPAQAGVECDGVQVVVDQGPLGGGVAVRCVDVDGDRSAAALTEQAGVAITWVQRYPGSFVCRLGGRPADLACAGTPPSDRYWGLFWAGSDDSSWTYSTQGAGSLTVPRDGVVGWRFQDGGRREDPAPGPAELPGDDTSARAAAQSQEPSAQPADPVPEDDDGRSATLAGVALVTAVGFAAILATRRRRAT